MKTLELVLPDTLADALEDAAQSGGFSSIQELAHEALRRYLESHSASLQEAFIKEDVTWGLYGHD